MTVRTFTADQLQAVARELTAGRTVIHVVAATDNVGWAAARTWDLARAVASGERRVALIDLSLDDPALHRMAQNTSEEGIVDAFLYGVSLSHVARQQGVPSLFYVGVGTRTSEPAEVWASRRWERLARGFQNEKAVLIAYVPPGALNRCALKADGMIVLAPDGYDPALDVAPGITRKLREGTPLLGVVTAADADASPKPESQPEAPSTIEPRPQGAAPSPRLTARTAEMAGEETEKVHRVPIPPTPPQAAQRFDEDQLHEVDLSPVDLADTDRRTLHSQPAPPAGFSADEVTEPMLTTVPTPDQHGSESLAAHPPVRLSRPPRAPATADEPYNGPPIFSPTHRRPIGNVLFLGGSVVAVAAVVIGYLLWNDRERPTAVESTEQPTEAVPEEPIVAEPVTATPPPVPVEPLTEADSLYYAIQAAALNTLEDAMAFGRDLRGPNRPITVSPVRIGGRIWYRVIVGAYPNPEAADAGRRALWEDGLVETGEGTILRTPQAFSLGRRDTIDSARVEAAGLWDQGIPAYVLPHAGGGIVAIGAFVRPEQASVAESILSAASLVTTLAPRLGST